MLPVWRDCLSPATSACGVDPCRYWYARLAHYWLLNPNYALLFIYKGRQAKIDVSVNISEGEFSSCLGRRQLEESSGFFSGLSSPEIFMHTPTAIKCHDATWLHDLFIMAPDKPLFCLKS